jgi:hypothetical protein
VVDLTVLGKRRAYLEQRLEKYDDFRLRFLLGFAEYYSGLDKPGLDNLTKAADYFKKAWGGKLWTWDSSST